MLGYGVGIWIFKSVTCDPHSLRITALKHHSFSANYLASLCTLSPFVCLFWLLKYQDCSYPKVFALALCLPGMLFLWLSPHHTGFSSKASASGKAFPNAPDTFYSLPTPHCPIILFYLYYCHLRGTMRCYPIHLLGSSPYPQLECKVHEGISGSPLYS